MKKIVLASKSIDRSWMFKHSGIQFEVFTTSIDEEKYKTKFQEPIELVKELAKAKVLYAKKELTKNNTDAIIIAADTIVELDGEIIGKAKDQNDAFKILKKLIGKTHNLLTGIAITEIRKPKIVIDYAITSVEFLRLSDQEIQGYIKSNEWEGRAGAYSIRDKASLFIKNISGSSSNVIGLPMHKIYLLLKKEFGMNLFI